MKLNLSPLGLLIKKYRNSKGYSTQQLASKLDVSAGLINNIENARNDVFRLELLTHFMQELDIPTNEVLVSILIGNTINTKEKSSTSYDDLKNITTEYINIISSKFTATISQYEEKALAVKLIGNHLLEELESIKQIKNVK